MKVEINNKEENKEIKFPCLMETAEGDIILVDGFSIQGKNYKGMALKHPDGTHYYERWAKHLLSPFNGSITLSND